MRLEPVLHAGQISIEPLKVTGAKRHKGMFPRDAIVSFGS